MRYIAHPHMNPYGQTQRFIMIHVVEACKRKSIPPPDQRLRSILAQQIHTLLNGGWKAEEIERTAVSLALSYDRSFGHQRMLKLQQSMERSDEDRQERDHIERLALERAEGIAPEVIKAMGLQRVALPSAHSFINAGGNTCRICTGPLGVHAG